MALGQYARNSPTRFDIISVTQTSGIDAGTIVLFASNTGTVTRQGGGVAPDVNETIRFTVGISASNAGGTTPTTFEWEVVPAPPPRPTGTAFTARVYDTDGYKSSGMGSRKRSNWKSV